MASSKPITISLPFPRTLIPELQDLPAEDAASIVQRCVKAEEFRDLSRRHMFQFRSVLDAFLQASASC